MLVIVGMRTEEHSLRSQVGIGSESHCLLGQGSLKFQIQMQAKKWRNQVKLVEKDSVEMPWRHCRVEKKE